MAGLAPPFDRLFADIKIAIPGAIDAVIQQVLFGVIEDFMKETNVWVEEIPFSVQPHKMQYVINPTMGSIVRLLMVFDPASAAPEKRWVQQGITFQPPNKINIMYSPSTATNWVAAVAKKISGPQAVQLPTLHEDMTWVIDRYRAAFVCGTLGEMYLQPAKPYSNVKLGARQWQIYISERSKARTEVLHANVYGGQRWMYPQGYATTARKGWT